MNLQPILYCLTKKKKDGTYRGEKIGVVRESFSSYAKGDLVLFDLYKDNYCSVESPFSAEEIEQHRLKESLLTTCRVIIGVPQKYIEEIVL
ncbi:MAG: hypothetical protein AABX16_04495 [Nanoarchaeota archaeon]